MGVTCHISICFTTDYYVVCPKCNKVETATTQVHREIRNKGSNIEASHVIVHCGTNNLTTDSGNVCARKIEPATMHDGEKDISKCADWYFKYHRKK